MNWGFCVSLCVFWLVLDWRFYMSVCFLLCKLFLFLIELLVIGWQRGFSTKMLFFCTWIKLMKDFRWVWTLGRRLCGCVCVRERGWGRWSFIKNEYYLVDLCHGGVSYLLNFDQGVILGHVCVIWMDINLFFLESWGWLAYGVWRDDHFDLSMNMKQLGFCRIHLRVLKVKALILDYSTVW